MLSKCAEGLEGESWDFRSNPSAMTAREMFHHLTETSIAFVTICGGLEHEWGSYQPNEAAQNDPWGTYVAARNKATALAEGGEDPKKVWVYLVAHESYHVGQLATIRVAIGNWDPYSIYQ